MNNFILVTTLSLFLALTIGCAKTDSSVANVTLANQAITGTAALLGRGALFALPAVSEFKICVAKIKLEDEDGESHTSHQEENGEIEFTPGLLNLTNGTQQDWGNVEIPAGFRLETLKIKVKRKPELCGVNYSMIFNGTPITEDVEFRWKFEPALDVTSASTRLLLSFGDVVTALRTAAEAGDLDNMKHHIEAVEESAQHESMED